MPIQLTSDDARQSLTAHVAAKGAEVCQKYGPHIGWTELVRILEDRTCVRYPCEIAFDSAPLEPGEFAHPIPKGQRPEDGYTLHVHPYFMTQLDRVPLLALYQLVLVNYGPFASADDAEAFASSALGLGKEDYYHRLCQLADELAACPTAW
jgi:hypothetical protein